MSRVVASAYDFLNISPNNVGDYTPHEIDLMMTTSVNRWKRNQTLADLRIARVCSILTSTKDDPHPPKEFMVDYFNESPTSTTEKRQTPEEMASIFKAIAMQSAARQDNG